MAGKVDGDNRREELPPIRRWSRWNLLLKKPNIKDFAMGEFHEGFFIWVDKAGGAIAKDDPGMLDRQSPAIAEFHQERSKRLAVQILP